MVCAAESRADSGFRAALRAAGSSAVFLYRPHVGVSALRPPTALCPSAGNGSRRPALRVLAFAAGRCPGFCCSVRALLPLCNATADFRYYRRHADVVHGGGWPARPEGAVTPQGFMRQSASHSAGILGRLRKFGRAGAAFQIEVRYVRNVSALRHTVVPRTRTGDSRLTV
jgi:hypothetical protein